MVGGKQQRKAWFPEKEEEAGGGHGTLGMKVCKARAIGDILDIKVCKARGHWRHIKHESLQGKGHWRHLGHESVQGTGTLEASWA